jgi:hypothetical protein
MLYTSRYKAGYTNRLVSIYLYHYPCGYNVSQRHKSHAPSFTFQSAKCWSYIWSMIMSNNGITEQHTYTWAHDNINYTDQVYIRTLPYFLNLVFNTHTNCCNYIQNNHLLKIKWIRYKQKINGTDNLAGNIRSKVNCMTLMHFTIRQAIDSDTRQYVLTFSQTSIELSSCLALRQ